MRFEVMRFAILLAEIRGSFPARPEFQAVPMPKRQRRNKPSEMRTRQEIVGRKQEVVGREWPCVSLQNLNDASLANDEMPRDRWQPARRQVGAQHSCRGMRP